MAAVLVLESPPDDAFHAPARDPVARRPLHQQTMRRGAPSAFNVVRHMLVVYAQSRRHFALISWSRGRGSKRPLSCPSFWRGLCIVSTFAV